MKISFYRTITFVFPILPLASAIFSEPALASATPLGEGFDVARYELQLRPNLVTTAVSGVETITLSGTKGGVNSLAFSPTALQISGATLDGEPVAVVTNERAVVFVLPAALPKGKVATLRFQFVGVPARGISRAPGGIYTGYFACDWMVCLQDSPGDKADFWLDLFLPRDATTLGIGQSLPLVQSSNGLMLHRWRSTRPYSPYLYGFVAGSFPQRLVRSGPDLFTYLDATGEGMDLDRQFAEAPSIAAFLSDKAGLPIPDHRYAQVLTPAREAQEAASFSLIGQGELSREQTTPSYAWVIAHEMAHQWWGNLVTCASWQDFWLNEGITTFMVAAWKEHRFGSVAYRDELDGAQKRVEEAKAAGFDKPLAWNGTYPSLATRRAVQYSKGALFLAHLREMVGEDAFWSGLRGFTRTYAGKTVTSRDFQSAMERASKKNLSNTFNQWVYGNP